MLFTIFWFGCGLLNFKHLRYLEYNKELLRPIGPEAFILVFVGGPVVLLIFAIDCINRHEKLRFRIPDDSEWTDGAWKHRLRYRSKQVGKGLNAGRKKVQMFLMRQVSRRRGRAKLF
jgi:hypothetical protein